MSIKGHIDCILIGENFSPDSIASQKGVIFFKQNEAGEIGVYGRYKGKKTPYGSAELDMSGYKETSLANQLDFVLEQVEKVREFDSANTIDIWVTISFYFTEEQCNFEFSKSQLASVVALGIDLSITCYSRE